MLKTKKENYKEEKVSSMLEHFTKKPFKDRIKDTGYLLKNSFKVIGKDEDIIKPTIRMAVYSSIMTILLFLSIAFLFFHNILFLVGVLLLPFTIIVLGTYRYFYYIKQKACQSWIVYNTITGKDISYADSKQHIKSERGKLTFIAFIDLIMAHVNAQKGSRQGIKGMLIHIFLAGLVEIWDLLSHYMIPAVVIEKKKLKELVPQIKALKNNVPATLAGVFGIDFVGNVVHTVVVPIYLLMIVISLGVGYGIALITETTAVTIGPITFSWVPVVLMIFIVAIIANIISIFVQSTKVIYFTIFYTSITRPTEIDHSMRGEMTHYLLMDKEVAPAKGKEKLSEHAQKLVDYIDTHMKHSSAKEIKKFLIEHKHPEKDIEAALKFLKKK